MPADHGEECRYRLKPFDLSKIPPFASEIKHGAVGVDRSIKRVSDEGEFRLQRTEKLVFLMIDGIINGVRLPSCTETAPLQRGIFICAFG